MLGDIEEGNLTNTATGTNSTRSNTNSPRSLLFRTIRPSDRDDIQRLHEQWFPVTYQPEFFDELVHGRMLGSSNNSQQTLYTEIAEHSGTIVGCLVGTFVPPHLVPKALQDPNFPDLFYIMTVGTVPQQRRSGLASTLIHNAMQHARSKSRIRCQTIYLHVKVDNVAAICMYESLGFTRFQEIPDYYHIDHVHYNSYLYVYTFSSQNNNKYYWQMVLCQLLWLLQKWLRLKHK